MPATLLERASNPNLTSTERKALLEEVGKLSRRGSTPTLDKVLDKLLGTTLTEKVRETPQGLHPKDSRTYDSGLDE